MNSSTEDIKYRINSFCEQYLPPTIPSVKNKKIIHDTIWHTNSFEPYEVAIIDTPLFQRLRSISQMGFVNYVYPSAKHTRFEHSLGVTVLASKMCDQINSNDPDNLPISLCDKRSIRLSALLHDIGHCLFSHTSESIYGLYVSNFFQEKKEISPVPHEIFGYLIITSNSFKVFFDKLKLKYPAIETIDIDEVASRIIGKTDNELSRYKTSIINGQFDADKLDYLFRDSTFCGLAIDIDVDRLLHDMKATLYPVNGDNICDLTIGKSAVSSFEQIIFNKMIFASKIYHHHKVRAIDCMFERVFEYILDNNIPIRINGETRPIESPVDFLYLLDYDLHRIKDSVTNDSYLTNLINDILNRNLIKRAFVFDKKSFKDSVNGMDLLDTGCIASSDRKSLQRELALKIAQDAKIPDKYWKDVWVDIKKPPQFLKGIDTTYVRSQNCDLQNISQFYPYKEYQDLYQTHKLQYYVFSPESYTTSVNNSSKKILKEKYNIY